MNINATGYSNYNTKVNNATGSKKVDAQEQSQVSTQANEQQSAEGVEQTALASNNMSVEETKTVMEQLKTESSIDAKSIKTLARSTTDETEVVEEAVTEEAEEETTTAGTKSEFEEFVFSKYEEDSSENEYGFEYDEFSAAALKVSNQAQLFDVLTRDPDDFNSNMTELISANHENKAFASISKEYYSKALSSSETEETTETTETTEATETEEVAE